MRTRLPGRPSVRVVTGGEAQLARRNPLRSWLAAALSVVIVTAAGLFMVRPLPAGAADYTVFTVKVTDTGFDPAVVSDVKVNDRLKFVLEATTNEHRVIFEDNSVCPGDRGAEPCWPELRFDGDRDNCFDVDENRIVPNARCMIVWDPGKTVRFHDYFNKANVGEIRVLGQPTSPTGPSTTTTTRPPTTTTTAPTTTTRPPTTPTTGPQTTTTTAPTQIRPLVISDPPSTTSTMAPPVSVTTNGATPAPTADKGKDKGKGKDKAKSKAAGAETPTTVTPVAPDALPPGTVFDPATLTPGPVAVPAVPGAPGADDVNLQSAAVMDLLDPEKDEPTDYRPVLLALGALALVLSICGFCFWFGRPSRYDPA